MTARRAVLLLASPASYRLNVFQTAVRACGIEPISGLIDPAAPLPDTPNQITLTSGDTAGARQKLACLRTDWPDLRVLAVDDTAVELAAILSTVLGITANDPNAANASRDKIQMRRLFTVSGLPSPSWTAFDPTSTPRSPIPYPVVLKPSGLNGSRGVIRADNDDSFAIASCRLAAILREQGFDTSSDSALVESFIPGEEVAIEGVMTDSQLTVLAIFDKPDPLNGPFFEETIYVTPSRHPFLTQTAIAQTVQQMAMALGLRHGPIHAEVRINQSGVWPIEVASRSIGGLCSSVLEFGAGMSLEELIVRHAFGEAIGDKSLAGAAGVMMIPIPRSGLFRSVNGIDHALAVPCITGIDITAKRNQPIQRLPEGDSYLGFIFARGANPESVEKAIRDAHACLEIDIAPTVPLAVQ